MSTYLCYNIEWDSEEATSHEENRIAKVTVGYFQLDAKEEAHEEGVEYVLGDKLANEAGWCVIDFDYCKVAEEDEQRFCAEWAQRCP
ncbi:hypothetical protein [Tsuneonella troitsensis]|uniref:hypothetical protein n=1 Tax=Tsuneonella troitsensis TaxID=292222 RepID=UPI000B26E444|nr:hypothetical protein [Tsuneonella troitsensis]